MPSSSLPEGWEGGAAVAQHGKASADIHGAQSGDESRHVEIGDEQARDQADEDGDHCHDQQDQRHIGIDGAAHERQAQALIEHTAHEHAHQTDHGADAQVDAAGDDDSVMPSASRPYSEVCRNISTMEFAVVKFGAQNEKKITSMMRAMNVRPLSRIMPENCF